MRVGVAGFGKMGAAMAARLAETGTTVKVWNRTAGRARDAGFDTAETPHALAAESKIVVSSLFDADAVDAVFNGRDGLVGGARGTLFIEMSTVSPETQRGLARRVIEAGGAFIECPVSGTTGPARAGQLVGLAGGDVAVVQRARPVLDKLCRRLEHVGDVGTGTETKLAVNLPLLAFWQAFGEAMALMSPLGKSPEWLVDLFSDTAGAAAVMKVKGPAIRSTLAGEDKVDPTFDIDAMRKDLRLMLNEAVDGSFELPVAKATLASFDEASASGWGRRDCAWIPAFCAAKARRSHLLKQP